MNMKNCPSVEIHYYGELVAKQWITSAQKQIAIGSVKGPIDILIEKNSEKLSYLDAVFKEVGGNVAYLREKDYLNTEIKTVTSVSEYVEENLVGNYDEVFKFFIEGLPHYLEPFGIVLPVNLMMPDYDKSMVPLVLNGNDILSCHGKIEILTADDEILGINYIHYSRDDAEVVFDSGKTVNCSGVKKKTIKTNKPSEMDVHSSVAITENAMIKLNPIEIYFDTPKSEIRWMR